MNDKIKVKLDPDEYRGWKLSFAKSHDRESDWQARKNGTALYANCPESLYWKIEETEKKARRIEPPIRALWLAGFGKPGWQAVEIHTIIGNGFHFRTVLDGEEHFEQMRSVSLDRDQNRERKFIFHSDENLEVMAKARKAREKSQKAEREAEQLMRTLRPVSDADLQLAAGD